MLKYVCKPGRYSPWLGTRSVLQGNKEIELFLIPKSLPRFPYRSITWMSDVSFVKSWQVDASQKWLVNFPASVCWTAVTGTHQGLVLLWRIDLIVWFFQEQNPCCLMLILGHMSPFCFEHQLAYRIHLVFCHSWIWGEAELTWFYLIFTDIKMLKIPQVPSWETCFTWNSIM